MDEEGNWLESEADAAFVVKGVYGGTSTLELPGNSLRLAVAFHGYDITAETQDTFMHAVTPRMIVHVEKYIPPLLQNHRGDRLVWAKWAAINMAKKKKDPAFLEVSTRIAWRVQWHTIFSMWPGSQANPDAVQVYCVEAVRRGKQWVPSLVEGRLLKKDPEISFTARECLFQYRGDEVPWIVDCLQILPPDRFFTNIYQDQVEE